MEEGTKKDGGGDEGGGGEGGGGEGHGGRLQQHGCSSNVAAARSQQQHGCSSTVGSCSRESRGFDTAFERWPRNETELVFDPAKLNGALLVAYDCVRAKQTRLPALGLLPPEFCY
jgi:hypothetical protein